MNGIFACKVNRWTSSQRKIAATKCLVAKKLQHLQRTRNNDFFNFIIFLQLKSSPFFCWFISLLETFLFYNLFLLFIASKSSSLWELNVYDGSLDVWWDFVLRCFFVLSFRLPDLKGKIFCFMYSSYVISSFLITILKWYYFVFSGQQFWKNN